MTFCFVRFCFKAGLCVALFLGLPGLSFGADTLLVSNHPERLEGPISLFLYQVPLTKTLRILYHHKNVSSVPLNLVISVKSTSGAGSVAALLAVAGPSLDEIFVGHKAVERYWEKASQKKTRVSITKQETDLLNVMIQPGEIVSGIFECESDVNAILESRVIDPLYPEASYAAMSKSSADPVYPSPSRTQHVSYLIGDVVGEIAIGAEPFVRNTSFENPLKGNYGVLYKIHASLENPDVVPRTVSLLFAPLGGVARAIIRVSGKSLYQTGNVGGGGFPSVVEVLQLKVPPKSKKDLFFEIIPQSGSYYPVHFVLRSEGPSTSLSYGALVPQQPDSGSRLTAMTDGVLQERVDNGY